MLPSGNMMCSHVEVEVRCAVGSEYLVWLLVQAGSVSWSSALFVARLRTAIELLIPDSAIEKALWRERLCTDSFDADVEAAIAVAPAISKTAAIPTAITRAIPRSSESRRQRRRRSMQIGRASCRERV